MENIFNFDAHNRNTYFGKQEGGGIIIPKPNGREKRRNKEKGFKNKRHLWKTQFSVSVRRYCCWAYLLPSFCSIFLFWSCLFSVVSFRFYDALNK